MEEETVLKHIDGINNTLLYVQCKTNLFPQKNQAVLLNVTWSLTYNVSWNGPTKFWMMNDFFHWKFNLEIVHTILNPSFCMACVYKPFERYEDLLKFDLVPRSEFQSRHVSRIIRLRYECIIYSSKADNLPSCKRLKLINQPFIFRHQPSIL